METNCACCGGGETEADGVSDSHLVAEPGYLHPSSSPCAVRLFVLDGEKGVLAEGTAYVGRT